MHAARKIFFGKRLRTDLGIESFGPSPILTKFLRHKIAKNVKLPACHLQKDPRRHKTDFAPQLVHAPFYLSILRPKVGKNRRVGESGPSAGIIVGTAPDSLLRRPPTIPSTVKEMIDMFKTDEERQFIKRIALLLPLQQINI